MTNGSADGRNLLLHSLPPQTLHALGAETINGRNGAVLFGPEETPEFVFFPLGSAVVSIVRSTEDGSMVESGVIGSEGMFSIHTVITDPAPTGSEAIVQIEGAFARVPAQRVRERFLADAALRQAVLAFTSMFLTQVTQNLVCNRLHEIERRLAKWLLVVRDRTAFDDLHLTHEFLSHMLGVHRPGVTIAISALETDELIAHTRSRIMIRSREALADRSCECYGVLHDSLGQLRATFAA
jgi:CRP-like cAMP-binding protein